MKTIKQITTWVAVGFFFTLYFPLFKGLLTTWAGTLNYSINVNNLARPYIVKLPILASVLFVLYALYFRPKLTKIAGGVAIAIVVLMQFILSSAAATNESLAFGFQLQWILVIVFALAVFVPNILLKGLEFAKKYIEKGYAALYRLIGEKPVEESALEQYEVEEPEELEEEKQE